jgi:HK97 family phage major capsid protein
MAGFAKEIRDELVKLITETSGAQLAELVAERVAAGLEPLQKSQGEWIARLHGAAAPAAPKTREKGEIAGRYIRSVAAAAYLTRSGGGFLTPADVLKRWGDDDLAKTVIDLADARTKAMAASTATDGGFLVPPQFSQDVVELLRPQSAVRTLGPMVIPMPNGNLSIPKVSAGASAFYQGENSNITQTQLALGNIKLTFKKLTALVPMSNDLLRFSSPAADTVVRDDVVRALAQRENSAFIRDDGTASAPKGLRFWAAPANIITSAGTSLANMTTDLGAMILSLWNVNTPMTRPGWLFSPRSVNALMTIQTTTGAYVFRDEMLRGTLWGWPYARNTGVPGSSTTGEAYLADFADVVIGEAMNLIVDASTEASYVDSTGATVSAYQQDQTIIRAITEHDLGVRRAESVAVNTAMSW